MMQFPSNQHRREMTRELIEANGWVRTGCRSRWTYSCGDYIVVLAATYATIRRRGTDLKVTRSYAYAAQQLLAIASGELPSLDHYACRDCRAWVHINGRPPNAIPILCAICLKNRAKAVRDQRRRR